MGWWLFEEPRFISAGDPWTGTPILSMSDSVAPEIPAAAKNSTGGGYFTSSFYDDITIFLIILLIIILLLEAKWIVVILVIVIICMLAYRPRREKRTYLQLNNYSDLDSTDFNQAIKDAAKKEQAAGNSQVTMTLKWN